jgi:putative serine protease PepD
MTTTDAYKPWYADTTTGHDPAGPEFAYPPPPIDPPPAPPAQPEPTSPPSPARRFALLAAAVLLAGAAGGGIVAAADRGSTATAAAPASVLRTTSVLSTTATAGTPEAAAAVIGPSVVTVEVSGTQVATSPFGQQQTAQVSDTGSGIVIRVDGTTGYILTNNHVVSAALSGGTVHITLNDGRTVAAAIVGHDTTSDLAVVKITGVSGLKAATFANSNALKVGQAVLAIGAPLGLSNTVTQGIVSTLHRPVTTGESGAGAQAVLDAVQTDAAINPGNSGGALVDLAGRVVGINSAIASTGSSGTSQAGNIGVGFAIPSNDAADVADQLIATGHATHAQIGISARDAASTTDGAPGLGASVAQTAVGGPAAKAGLQAGDLITKVGDRVVTDADSLIVAVRANKPGTTVTVTYTRGGQIRTAAVTLAAATSS